jgi:hypothetical protein
VQHPREPALPLPAGTWREVLDWAEPRWQGEGAPAPPEIIADGPARLRVAPWNAVMYVA